VSFIQNGFSEEEAPETFFPTDNGFQTGPDTGVASSTWRFI